MPFKYYIIYMKPLYRQNNHYIGKSTTSRLTYRLVTKSVPCRLDSTYRLENLDCWVYELTLYDNPLSNFYIRTWYTVYDKPLSTSLIACFNF
jgi:hypothetical protein